MGQGSSSFTSSSNGQGYSQRAQLAKQLPDYILTFFFSNADLQDLINLSSLDACSRYVFTTSQSLDTLFQKLQVTPQRGKQGEILFAPLSRLVPIPSKSGGDQQAIAERKRERDRMCMEISYYYVRLFQIYAALSMTTLNADPMRRPVGPSVQAPRVAPSAPLLSGGALPALLRSQDPTFNDFLQKIKGTPLMAMQEFLNKKQGRNVVTFDMTSLRPAPNYELFIDYTNMNITKQDVSFRGSVEGSDLNIENIDIGLSFVGTQMTRVELRMDGNLVLTFAQSVSGKWTPQMDAQRIDFAEAINDFLRAKYTSANMVRKPENKNRRPVGVGVGVGVGVSAPYTGATGTGLGIPSAGPATASISGYEKYDTIKKLFQDRFNGKDFPKAFCVARAMTLLLPIFQEELPRTQAKHVTPFYSQICKNTYDFETTDVQMPKHPKTPAANLYFRSLVSLYYDDYRMSNPEKPPEFYQTETGRSELRRDSAILAKLYNIEKDPETFLESSSPFKAFPICGAAAGQQDRLIQIDDRAFVTALHTNVIRPMLAFQEQHSQRVNALLKRMFDLRLKKVDGRDIVESMRLMPEIKNGGRAAIDAIGRDARALLKDYYWKSEAYFFKGMLMFMETQGKPQVWKHI